MKEKQARGGPVSTQLRPLTVQPDRQLRFLTEDQLKAAIKANDPFLWPRQEAPTWLA